jgi:hypothetical protein
MIQWREWPSKVGYRICGFGDSNLSEESLFPFPPDREVSDQHSFISDLLQTQQDPAFNLIPVSTPISD